MVYIFRQRLVESRDRFANLSLRKQQRLKERKFRHDNGNTLKDQL
jgi:hypothetical protein